MIEISKLYLVPVIYGQGLNLVAQTITGEWYQQKHVSLEMMGGGSADWFKLDVDANSLPIIHDLNPLSKHAK